MPVTACSGAQRLAVLPDGRILFASVPVALPLATPAVPGIARLFLIDPAQGKDARPVAVPADPQSLPGTLQFLAVPPDGKHVALVDGRKDAVAVLDCGRPRDTTLWGNASHWRQSIPFCGPCGADCQPNETTPCVPEVAPPPMADYQETGGFWSWPRNLLDIHSTPR